MLAQNAMSAPAPAPILSIIVVCRNPGPRLSATLTSVWEQKGPAPELVVIDGASTDGSREWLEARRDQIAILLSESDRGIYDAMNKGLARARGRWVLFLGADDVLADSTVLARLAATLVTTDADVVMGEALFDDGRRYPPSPATAIRRNFLHHQATFYRRMVFASHPGFDTDLYLMADYDLNLRLLRGGVRMEMVPGVVAKCASGGESDRGSWLGYREEIEVRHRHFQTWRCLLWDAVSVVRWMRKQVVRRARPA
jgi:glycosyltransferase involved in cell wall biosynthesis